MQFKYISGLSIQMFLNHNLENIDLSDFFYYDQLEYFYKFRGVSPQGILKLCNAVKLSMFDDVAETIRKI